MSNSLRFETPENVQVQYTPAGPGTRFVAWFVDQLIVIVVSLIVIILLLVSGASFAFLWDEANVGGPNEAAQIFLYFAGMMLLVWSLGSFVYFGCLELFMRGQTLGKKLLQIRVVKTGGFQLDTAGILIRNIFRVIDNFPFMWVIPIVSRLGQRTGDMVAGTIVVSESRAELSPVRTTLAARIAADAQFRFDEAALKRLANSDYFAVERLLERWPDLPTNDRDKLLPLFSQRIAEKIKVEAPPAEQQLRYLEDLLSAELRRQERHLV
jgi:uncharacterized RDD family membrane protein YckC